MRLLLGLALFALPMLRVPAAEPRPLTLYLQFVIGTAENKPPAAGAKPIGPKLSGLLSPVFKWNHYWEVRQHTVILAKDQLVKIRTSTDRTMELELTDATKIELRSYWKGELRRKVGIRASQKLAVLGGDAEGNDGWFFVVRRDKPSTE